MAASVRFFNDTVRRIRKRIKNLSTMLPTRWPYYSLLVFAGILGLVLPVLMSAIWRRARGARAASSVGMDAAAATVSTRIGEAEPIALRFHLAALLFPGFLGLALLLAPMLIAMRGTDRIEAALTVGAVGVPFLIALFYCVRRGDLSWNAPRTRAAEPWRTE
jgi:NADH:ubiquinone oxidoreductase subunit 3 (subunit A)